MAGLTLVVATGGLFLAVMSTTMVSVALPTIGRDLHASPTELEWVVDAYVVVYAGLLLPGGALGDYRGRKGLFMMGVAIFGLGAAITGIAPSLGWVFTGRVMQGMGPALLVPGSLTMIRATFSDSRQRALAIGVWSTASGGALAVGPALGGIMVTWAGWRWVFLGNVPLVVALLIATARFVPAMPTTSLGRRFDWTGAFCSVFGIAALAFACIEGQMEGWTSAAVFAGWGAGGGALAIFLISERRRSQPLVDLSLFAKPAFIAANVSAFVVFFAFVGTIIYFSAYFQDVQGQSPIAAGVDVATIGIAYAIATPISGRLVGRIGERRPLVIGLVIAGAATLGLLRLGTTTPISAIWWDFAILGAGIGLAGTPMSTIAMSAVGAASAGMASAIVNSVRQVGQVFGVAVLGALVYSELRGGASEAPSTAAQSSRFVTGLHSALWLAGIALLGAAALALTLLRRQRGGYAHSGGGEVIVAGAE